MHRSNLMVAALVVAGIVSARPGEAQLPSSGWTERPDAIAPAGLANDRILEPGTFEARYTAEVVSFEGLKVGTNAIQPEFVLRDWDLAPTSMTHQRHQFEFSAGLLDWLGASLRVPVQHASTTLVSQQLRGNPTATGLGDVELRALLGLHDTWPYRAHLIAGVSFPTGSVEEAGQLPNAAVGGADRTLPYPMQPGDGTFAVLPGAVLVAENAVGTVGLRADARVPMGENDRGWTRGTEFSGQAWLAYRFTDWISGSARLSYRNTADLVGADRSIDAFSSPLAHPDLQSGTRIDLPIGMNIRFAEGSLEGSHLGIELIVPLHQDVDGPQLTPNSGVAFSWGVNF